MQECPKCRIDNNGGSFIDHGFISDIFSNYETDHRAFKQIQSTVHYLHSVQFFVSLAHYTAAMYTVNFIFIERNKSRNIPG